MLVSRCVLKHAVNLFVILFASESFGNDLFHQMTNMVNNERQRFGLIKLEYNNKLEQAALSHSHWMAQVGRMSHTQGQLSNKFLEYLSSDYDHAARIMKTGYVDWQDLFDRNGDVVLKKSGADRHVSEIIAYASPGNGTVHNQLPIIVRGWMNSPGHKEAILKNYWQHIGGAFAVSRDGSVYYCVTFGLPAGK